MGLWNLRHKNAKKLSGGETQRMALCRVLVARHKVLLPDEPTSAMDVEATAVAEKVLDGYYSSYSPTIIFATHSIKQAERIADYVLFLHDGKLVEYGAPKDLFGSPPPKKKLDRNVKLLEVHFCMSLLYLVSQIAYEYGGRYN